MDTIKKENYYIVIGAGDLIFLENSKKINIDKISMCRYRLSDENYETNRLRNIYTGMPYCHNAIIFKKNNLRYSERYLICSDYDYFLKYLKYEKINIAKSENFNQKITIVFESKGGVSSRSFFRKNYENFSIIFKNLGFKYIFLYIFLNIKKLIKRTYE